MKFLRAALVLLVAVNSQNVFAGNTTYSGSLLAFIGTDWNGAGYIFAFNHGPASQCASGQFSISASAPGYKDQVAALMRAWILCEPIIVTEDSTDSCPNGRANVIAVDFLVSATDTDGIAYPCKHPAI